MIPTNNERRAPAGIPQDMVCRAVASFKASTLRESDRSVEYTLATETPAKVWDWERWEVITEVLAAGGMILPKNRQIPLGDSHRVNESVQRILGSVREIRVENNEIVGRAYYARDPLSVETFGKVQDGHIPCGSVGYQPVDRQWIDKGESYDYNGRTYVGPMMLTKTWMLKEYSACGIPADEGSSTRCETDYGAKAEPNDVNNSRSAESNIEPIKEGTAMSDENKTPATNPADTARMAELEAELKATKRKNDDLEIEKLCKKHNCEAILSQLIGTATVDQARTAILEEMERVQKVVVTPTPAVEMGKVDNQKRTEILTNGLLLRGLPAQSGIANPDRETLFARSKSLLDIGRECLESQGISTRHMTKEEIARKLITSRNAIAADMTTASFGNITENVLGKAVMQGFSMQQRVWDSICAVGSTADFKPVSRVGLSENADLPLKREGGEYKESKFSDRKESGAVATYADKTTLTEEAIINDDLSALAAIPFRKGAAAMRVPEALLFAAINSPPELNETGKGWFDATNTVSNDITQADGLTSKNLSTVRATMRKMPVIKHSSETATDYYDIMPRVLLVHPDHEDTAKILINSSALPATSMSSGIYNPNSDANLMVKASARITTTTNFYVFADPNLHPVCEMLFLNGRVAPESFLDESTNIDGLTFRIRIRCGLIVLEWRTAIRHKVS